MWDRLVKARADDPGGREVVAAADDVLASDAPVTLQLAALRAKAEYAYAHGDDVLAIGLAERGLALVAAPDPGSAPQTLIDLARVRARAMVRGGDPTAAIAAIDHPVATAGEGWPGAELAGLRAVAADRNGDWAAAVAGLARWRELLTDADPSALWAEHRMARLADGLPPATLRELVDGLPPSPARACLAAKTGEPTPPGMPAWVAACARATGHIGIVLPRSGPLAAFADTHLAAAMATLEAADAHGPRPQLRWRDSGSSAKSARRAAKALVGRGRSHARGAHRGQERPGRRQRGRAADRDRRAG
ncbi:MAG: hypothetical protein K0V04_06795 [Deltaproteobacteria bacterium]|nr:hypothetical protein [Deltaproteobacteria bacterium]